MTDKTWANWSDLKFIARKREFWLTAIAGTIVGAVIGWLV
jgi:F0F1-type ATP synthase assembly protein I